MWPVGVLPSENGLIYGSKNYGRIVRLLKLDLRSEKSNHTTTDGPSKTMTGVEQENWLLKEVNDATEELIVIQIENAWVSGPTTDDWWGNFINQRTRLANALAALISAGKRIEITAGDMHALAINDGSSSPGGIPVYHAGPANQIPSHKGGPYTSGPFPTTAGGTTTVQQYGTLEVIRTDLELRTIFRGYNSDDLEVMSDTKVWAMSGPPAGEGTVQPYFGGLEVAPRLPPRTQAENVSWYPAEASYISDVLDRMLVHMGFQATDLPSRSVGSLDPSHDVNVMVKAVNAICERLGIDNLDIPERKTGDRGQFKDFSRILVKVRDLIPILNATPPYTGVATAVVTAPTNEPVPPPEPVVYPNINTIVQMKDGITANTGRTQKIVLDSIPKPRSLVLAFLSVDKLGTAMACDKGVGLPTPLPYAATSVSGQLFWRQIGDSPTDADRTHTFSYTSDTSAGSRLVVMEMGTGGLALTLITPPVVSGSETARTTATADPGAATNAEELGIAFYGIDTSDNDQWGTTSNPKNPAWSGGYSHLFTGHGNTATPGASNFNGGAGVSIASKRSTSAGTAMAATATNPTTKADQVYLGVARFKVGA